MAERRRGRPPLDPETPSYRVKVSVAAGQYDKAETLARREGVSVQQIFRRGLSKALDDADDDD